jgi:hypothetical protein
VSAGRIGYDPITTGDATRNVIGTVRFDAVSGGWVYAAAAMPLSDRDPVWGGGGGGGRVITPRGGFHRISGGADLAGEGFTVRDRVGGWTGNGGTFDAIPFVRLTEGATSIEGRAGWRGYALSQAGVQTRRSTWETGARVSYSTRLLTQADVRWVHASEGTFPFVGASMAYVGSRAQVWGHAGRWFRGITDNVTWSVGGGVPLGRSTIWAAVRQDATDPLFWNARRRAWSVGLTQRFGNVPSGLQPVTRTSSGETLIRLRQADAPAGAISIAGDFTNWQPRPMQREGAEWVLRLPLAPGVYNYAFRTASGEWFVPASTPGRRDDGFGGHVAVLVVM